MSTKVETDVETTKYLSDEEEKELKNLRFTADNFVCLPWMGERIRYLEMKMWNL